MHQRRQSGDVSGTHALLRWLTDAVHGQIDKHLRCKLKSMIERKFQPDYHYTEFFRRIQKFYRDRLSWRGCDE